MMKIVSLFKRFTIALFLVFSITAQAGGSQPVFTIVPLVRAPAQITANGTGFATYQVTNTSIFNRTLVMQPISGVIQRMGVAGDCPYPFPLTVGQSCLLRLQLFGSEIPRPLFYGPVICKTKSATDLRPDPFLCAKPTDADVLRVIVTPAVPATINVVTTQRTFSVGSTTPIVVINTSTSAFAQNVSAQIPAGSPLTIASNSCGAMLAPGSSCTIIFTSAVATGPTAVTISGTNTNQDVVVLQAIFATLNITPSSLTFTEGATGQISVQNTSPIAATGMVYTIPAPLTTVTNTCGTTIAANATCVITIGSAVSTNTTVTIAGGNTTPPSTNVNVIVTPVTISVAPASLQYEIGQTQVLVVTNTSPLGSPAALGLDVDPTVPAGMTANSTCPPALPATQPPTSCNITFGGAIAQVATINVFGTNTNVVPVNVQIVADPILIVSPTTSFISIDGNGGTQTAVTLTNTSTAGVVTGVSATLPAPWVGTVNLDDSQCANLVQSPGPGNTCQLLFSSDTPFIPAVLPITTTSPIANPLLIAIGFTSGSGGDLVFDVDAGADEMSLVTNADNGTMPWGTIVFALPENAGDPSDGAENTQAIVDFYNLFSVPQSDYPAGICFNFTGSGIGVGGWFLPAQTQLGAMYANFINIDTSGINIGNFQTVPPYWSSTVNNPFDQEVIAQYFSSGISGQVSINNNFPFRCARTANYPVP